MAEKIHFQQVGLLKGCSYPTFFNPVSFIQYISVEPTDQFSFPAPTAAHFPHLIKHAILLYLFGIITFLNLLRPNLKKKYIDFHTIPLDSIRNCSRVFSLSQIKFPVFFPEIKLSIKHLSEFTSRLSGLVFFLFDYMHVEKNAHWRTIVVTQQ